MTKSSKMLIDLRQLQELTPARVGLVRAGSSISTKDTLHFEMDHARARDAVHLPFNSKDIIRQLDDRQIKTISVHSEAKDRLTYLQRPDLGRQLEESSKLLLRNSRFPDDQGNDLAIVIADGLSTHAIHCNAITFLDEFLSLLPLYGWSYSPVIIASQARVAIADEIGEILNARLSIILIGERPGLSASDSMGIYITYAPRKGRSDAERNCISNIRPGGLNYPEAARRLEVLISNAFKLRLSGVSLKETKMV